MDVSATPAANEQAGPPEVSRRGASFLRWSASVVLPLLISASLLHFVLTCWQTCTGSEEIARAYGLRQILWVFVLPSGGYVMAFALRAVLSRSSVAASAARAICGTGLVGMFYVYLNIRYFQLNQNECTNGLPLWWPDFLPARG